MYLTNKKTIILILSLFAIVIFLFFLFIYTNKQIKHSSKKTIPIPTAFYITTTPSLKQNTSKKILPTLPQQQGGGVNTNDTEVKKSEEEIQKLSSALPYEKDILLSTGVTVSIVIPKQTIQSNSWTLKVQIFGINYNTSIEQSDYEVMKQSFLEATQDVFAWVRINGANPKEMYFVWGDRAYIQNRAEEWLYEQ